MSNGVTRVALPDAISRLSPAELQLAAAGLKVLVEVTLCASDVVRIRSETQRFVAQVDKLEELLALDAAAVWQIVEPLTTLLLTDRSLAAADRLKVVEAIRIISAPSVQRRADAIQSVASKIRT